MRALSTLVVLLAFVAGNAGSAELAKPTIHSFATTTAKADLHRSGRAVVPAPELSTLWASVDEDGIVRLRCSGVENPAYKSWLERVEHNARQEQ